MKAITSALSGLKERLPELAMPEFALPELPRLGREVAVPVYLIHTGPDPEAYFFIFDFEEFVERSREGIFVRPKLKLWAGREDFSRAEFARQFRVSFGREFEAARLALGAEKKSSGWFGWLKGAGGELIGSSISQFAANVVLLVALSAGRMVLSQILPAALSRVKSDAAKLEQSIEETKEKVDAALRDFDVTLHADLYVHAFGARPHGEYEGMDFDAWPLPDFVQTHLGDTETTSWW